MRAIESLLGEYAESHQNKTNKAIHYVCVPLIFWTVVALLWEVKLPFEFSLGERVVHLNAAMIALVFVLIYYVRLSFMLAVGMLLYALACAAVCYTYNHKIIQHLGGFPLWAMALVVFVVAWIFQFYGHNIEGKKPSFLKDLQFLLIGPAWIMSFIYKKAGLSY
jgi:uncharacterized membrane protein YGL010W